MSYLCCMKKIGNVVTKNKLELNKRFNQVASMDDIIPGIPTLIVGFNEVKTLYPDFNINKLEISQDLYWCFNKNEKRDSHRATLSEFISICYSELTNDIIYLYIDPIHFSKKKLKKVSDKLKSIDNLIGAFINDEVIYLYGDNIIFSFDIEMCKFAGINTEKLIEKYRTMCNGFLDSETIFIYNDDVNLLSNRFIPFLYKIDNEQTNSRNPSKSE